MVFGREEYEIMSQTQIRWNFLETIEIQNPIPQRDGCTIIQTMPEIYEIDDDKESILENAEELKAKGNERFIKGHYDEARELYTKAIETLSTSSDCSVVTGKELLDLRDDHEGKERQRVTEIRKQQQRMGMTNKQPQSQSSESDGNGNQGAKVDNEVKMVPFVPPKSDFPNELAIYHSNRSACMSKLLDISSKSESLTIEAGLSYDFVIDDCDIALLHKPGYVKALLRRMNAYEKMEKYEDALQDAREALVNETKSSARKEIQNHISRLERLHREKMQKLQEETMGKLKDLGNSFLSNFGMSLDQFKAEKDPNTGSYNISFGK